MARKRGYKKARNFGEAVLPYPGQPLASAASIGKSAAWMAGSFTATFALSRIAGSIVKKYVPASLKEGIAGKAVDVAVDVLSAGAVGLAATRFAPARSRSIYTAAFAVPVLNVVMPENPLATLASTVMQKTGIAGWADDGLSGWSDDGLSGGDDYGMGDFTSIPSVAQAPRLMADFADPRQMATPVMGDFADPRQLTAPIMSDDLDGIAESVATADAM